MLVLLTSTKKPEGVFSTYNFDKKALATGEINTTLNADFTNSRAGGVNKHQFRSKKIL